MKDLKAYEQEFADLYRKTGDAELAFVKAFNKWAKLRKQCVRAEKRLEKALAKQPDRKTDWTKLFPRDQASTAELDPGLLELAGQERLF